MDEVVQTEEKEQPRPQPKPESEDNKDTTAYWDIQ
jgi:hypothetical protein